MRYHKLTFCFSPQFSYDIILKNHERRKYTEKTNKIRLDVMIVVGLFSLLFLGLQAEAEAKSAVPVEGAKFSVSVSLKDNLKSLIGKDVVVNLRSGKTYQGFVNAVGDEFVHLEKLSGRDFYDALVRIADISSIELKFRDMK